MKVAIVNQPLKNRGDEAAHKAFIRRIIKEKAISEIDVIFLNAQKKDIDEIKVDNEKVNYINLQGISRASYWCMKFCIMHKNFLLSYIHPLLCQYIKLIKKYDCVICAPGGICMGGFMNWSHIWQLYIPMRYKKRIVYWSRSIGPFTNDDFAHQVFAKRSEELLNYFAYLSVRDEISFSLAQKSNINTHITLDSVFLEQHKCDFSIEKLGVLEGERYCVVVPNELTWHYKYSKISQVAVDDFFINILEKLTVKYPNYKIVMLPQLNNINRGDYIYFCSLKNKVKNGKNIVVLPEQINSDIQQLIIRKADFLIGARYHSIIFAINTETKFVSLSYEHKMRGMLKILNLSDREINLEAMLCGNRCIYEDVYKNLFDKLDLEYDTHYYRNKAHLMVEEAIGIMMNKIMGN